MTEAAAVSEEPAAVEPAGEQATQPESEPVAGDVPENPSSVAYHNFAAWHGKDLIDSHGDRIGRLEDVYFDVETDEPQFATVKQGLIDRHLTFVPLTEVTIGPDSLQVATTRTLVKNAPNLQLDGDELSQADESALYHHYQLNYTPSTTPSGRRLARR